MKNLIAILTLTVALLFIGNIQAQSSQIRDIEDINLRMNAYSKQNSIGNGFIISGFLTSVLGGGIIFSEYNNSPSLKPSKQTLNFGSGVLIVGTILTSTGVIINLNSHNRLKDKRRN